MKKRSLSLTLNIEAIKILGIERMKTLQACVKSVNKWYKIAFEDGVDRGSENCPLCKMFNYDFAENPCRGCPIFSYTSRIGCENTPFIEWSLHQQDEHIIHTYEGECKVACDTCKDLAIDEYMFLFKILEKYIDELILDLDGNNIGVHVNERN